MRMFFLGGGGGDVDTRKRKNAWTLQCVWESVYPTMDLMDIMRMDHNQATGNDKMKEEHEPMIRAHHVVCYYLGQLDTTISTNATNNSHNDSSKGTTATNNEQQQKPKTAMGVLDLCTEEVDGAVWLLSHDDIQRIVMLTSSNELFQLKLEQQQQNDNSNIDGNKNSSNESIEEILLWNNIKTTIPFHASHDDNGVISDDDDDEIKEPQHAVTFRTLATPTITTSTTPASTTITTIPLSDLVGIYSRSVVVVVAATTTTTM